MRKCDECGKTIREGYTTISGAWSCCEECFEGAMNRMYGDHFHSWVRNDHEDDPEWEGGYYDAEFYGEYIDTGIYWTEWR